ncbi:hypothetical protein B0J18DRAFT_248167 [Chaetomium sp. MPI-SDFR-AT-0129]|nr:hypothetical protein B0J18DRAFT_248167 [Chaetomium sp. MPI-SDFR-AT-0129]
MSHLRNFSLLTGSSFRLQSAVAKPRLGLFAWGLGHTTNARTPKRKNCKSQLRERSQLMDAVPRTRKLGPCLSRGEIPKSRAVHCAAGTCGGIFLEGFLPCSACSEPCFGFSPDFTPPHHRRLCVWPGSPMVFPGQGLSSNNRNRGQEGKKPKFGLMITLHARSFARCVFTASRKPLLCIRSPAAGTQPRCNPFFARSTAPVFPWLTTSSKDHISQTTAGELCWPPELAFQHGPGSILTFAKPTKESFKTTLLTNPFTLQQFDARRGRR